MEYRVCDLFGQIYKIFTLNTLTIAFVINCKSFCRFDHDVNLSNFLLPLKNCSPSVNFNTHSTHTYYMFTRNTMTNAHELSELKLTCNYYTKLQTTMDAGENSLLYR